MKKEYALYKGDTLLYIGTIDEIASQHGVKHRTICFYMTPTYKKRTSENALRLVSLGEIE